MKKTAKKKTARKSSIPQFRYIMHVTTYAGGWQVWHQTRTTGRPRKDGKDRVVLYKRGDKAYAVNEAALLAARLWALHIPVQVVIHKANGQIQSERTYGYDPKARKG
jgi:hypothetical protein